MAQIGLLSKIVINTPCTESWEKMSGDEKKRFCSQCKKNVFNIREMTTAEAEALLLSGDSICAQLYRRPDGTVLTKECGVGKRRRWRIFAGYIIALLSALGLRRELFADSSPIRGKVLVPEEHQIIKGGITIPEEYIESYELGEISIPTPTPTPTKSR